MFVQTDWAIYPRLQYPKTHFSNIPAFQHSNGGEAPIVSSPCYNNTDFNKKKAGTIECRDTSQQMVGSKFNDRELLMLNGNKQHSGQSWPKRAE
jgi:hypothetical protein